MTRLTESELDDLEHWSHETGIRNIANLVQLAVAEIRERRTVDRNLVAARPRNVRFPGQRRRK